MLDAVLLPRSSAVPAVWLDVPMATVPPTVKFPVKVSAAPPTVPVKLGLTVPAGPPVPEDAPERRVATPEPSPLTPVLIGKPVVFVRMPDAGVPRAGVTRVGEFEKTATPVPVSSERTPASWAEVVAAKNPRFFAEVATAEPISSVNVPMPGVGLTTTWVASTAVTLTLPLPRKACRRSHYHSPPRRLRIESQSKPKGGRPRQLPSQHSQ